MNYSYVISPITNKKVSIYSSSGKTILKLYLRTLLGGYSAADDDSDGDWVFVEYDHSISIQQYLNDWLKNPFAKLAVNGANYGYTYKKWIESLFQINLIDNSFLQKDKDTLLTIWNSHDQTEKVDSATATAAAADVMKNATTAATAASPNTYEKSNEDNSMFHSCLSESIMEDQQKTCQKLLSSCDGDSSAQLCDRFKQLALVASSRAAEETESSRAEEKPSRLNPSVLIDSMKATLKVTNIYVINGEEHQEVEVEKGKVCKPKNNNNFLKTYNSRSQAIIEFDSSNISEGNIEIKKIDTTMVTKTILGKVFTLANKVEESKINFNKENNSTFKTIIKQPYLIGFNPESKKMESRTVLRALDFKTTVSFKLSDETELMTYTIPFKIW